MPDHKVLASVVIAMVAVVGVVRADVPQGDQNWAQWRGPLASGAATDAHPPTTWSETTHVRWKVSLPGEGSSTPIIWGDKVFVQAAIATGKKAAVASPPPAQQPEPAPGPQQNRRGGRGGFGGAKPTEAFQFVLYCLDRKTGKILWQQVAREVVPHEAHHPSEGFFASQSPITDGEHVYAYFGSEGLYCYDMAGKQIWARDLGKMRILLGFGEGSSAALYKDKLIVNWDNEDESFITALDKSTGKTLWKTPRDEKTTWATPLVVEHGGKAQIITAGTKKIRSYDVETGQLIWESKGLTRNVIPSPVAADGVVYLTSGYQGNALQAIRLGGSGDLSGTDSILWSWNKKTPYVPSPLLYEGRIYLFSANSEILSCFEAKTGKPLIDGRRVEGLVGVFASPVAAANHVYLTGRNGVTVVIKASDTFEPVATNQLDDKIDASPAIAGNEIFLRGRQSLYCIAEQ